MSDRCFPPSAATVLSRTLIGACAHEGATMAGKSPRKTNAKTKGTTLKEKQTAKKQDKAKARQTSHIPPAGH